MKKLLVALLLLSTPALADVRVKRFHTAGVTCPSTVTPANCRVQNASVLDTSASFTMDVFGFDKLNLQINHTFVAATAISVICEGSLDGGATWARITSTAIAAGTGTVSRYIDNYPTGSASTNILLEYGVQGYTYARCDLGDTAATTDTVIIFANVSVVE